MELEINKSKEEVIEKLKKNGFKVHDSNGNETQLSLNEEIVVGVEEREESVEFEIKNREVESRVLRPILQLADT